MELRRLLPAQARGGLGGGLRGSPASPRFPPAVLGDWSVFLSVTQKNNSSVPQRGDGPGAAASRRGHGVGAGTRQRVIPTATFTERG